MLIKIKTEKELERMLWNDGRGCRALAFKETSAKIGHTFGKYIALLPDGRIIGIYNATDATCEKALYYIVYYKNKQEALDAFEKTKELYILDYKNDVIE